MSQPSFDVQSVHGGTRLAFRGEIPRNQKPYDGFDVDVHLYGGGVEATERVHDHLPHHWTEFFEGLSATTDRTGHVELRVEMRGDMGGSDWRAADTIYVEAGQLDELARRARDYFG